MKKIKPSLTLTALLLVFMLRNAEAQHQTDGMRDTNGRHLCKNEHADEQRPLLKPAHEPGWFRHGNALTFGLNHDLFYIGKVRVAAGG